MLFLILLTLFLRPLDSKAFVCDSNDESPIQTVRNFYWILMGFPGTEEYNCVTQNDSTLQSVIKSSGLVGEIELLRVDISSALVKKYGSSTTCAAIPSSGSTVIGPGKTLYFETPQQTIPATFPSAGGSYQKRIRYVNTSTNETVKFEFDCENQRMYSYKSKTFTSTSFKIVVFYDNTTSVKYIDTYLHDDGNMATGQDLSKAVILRVTPTTNKFEMWQTRTGYKTDNSFQSYRFTTHANYSTQQSSLHYNDLSGIGLTTANYNAHPEINSIVVTALNAPDGSGGGGGGSDSLRQGCATDFSIKARDITSNALCAGLALSQPPNTAFGDSMSMQSVHQNLKNRINALP
jgi:hypothetical protein